MVSLTYTLKKCQFDLFLLYNFKCSTDLLLGKKIGSVRTAYMQAQEEPGYSNMWIADISYKKNNSDT